MWPVHTTQHDCTFRQKANGDPTWRRLSARRPSVSEDGGSVCMMMESEVAMSLKGMPTASLQPSFLYSTCGKEARVSLTQYKLPQDAGDTHACEHVRST